LEKLGNFSEFVTTEKIDSSRAGNWRKLFGNENPLHVELGTGKGDFICQMAENNPEINFVGLEMEAEVVLKAARKIEEKNLKNVKIIVFNVNNIQEVFAENEIDRLYINFCDPWPKKKHAKRRLTYITFLQMYKKILKPDGEIHFKTDNRALFDFSLEQFELANLKVSDVSYDLHANEPPENIRTEYENRFSAEGVPINRAVVHL
jgi:tRNA (guanine-N7-)-methyltransferase